MVFEIIQRAENLQPEELHSIFSFPMCTHMQKVYKQKNHKINVKVKRKCSSQLCLESSERKASKGIV